MLFTHKHHAKFSSSEILVISNATQTIALANKTFNQLTQKTVRVHKNHYKQQQYIGYLTIPDHRQNAWITK